MSIRDGKCVIVRDGDTREDLIAWGMKPEAADEVLNFRAYLTAKGEGRYQGSFADWKLFATPPTTAPSHHEPEGRP